MATLTYTIEVPESLIRAAMGDSSNPWPGRQVVTPIKVNWPELQLTESQILENALDRANGQPGRHIDRSIIDLSMPYIVEPVAK